MAGLATRATYPAPAARPAPDRAPDWVAAGTPEPLRGDLMELLGAEGVRSRPSDLIRYASDASPYRLIPKAVAVPRDAEQVAALMRYARRAGVTLTFRAAGTSLNGQGQSDSVLVDVRENWRGLRVEDEGRSVRVRPGTVLGHVNRVLAPLGRRLGPDPASTDIACAGGVIANNSGGMRCGVQRDSYRTLRSLSFVTPSGTAIDSADPGAERRFAAAEPELARGLAEIRDEIRADRELSERIRRKFEIKNTTGYRLCAFLDADSPVQIYRRLLVGSEGTLGFVSEAVFETVPVPPVATVSWLHFPSIDAAVAPVSDLVVAGARAVELMVAPALIVASQHIRGAPQSWQELPPESAALLVEFGGNDGDELDRHEAAARELLADHHLIREPDFHRDARRIEVDWTVREGLHGLIGKLRPPETALIVEDVCVPPARIAAAAADLQALLGEHGFLTGVAGHASAGNLHFMLTPDFAKAEDRDRYESFMARLVELVVDRYDGSLKAEHGTGINMTPYVEREWGGRATELMWRVKRLADPEGVLAPGVVLSRDAGAHLRNLRTTPPIEEEVASCVECGFCEPVCPSRWLTTTPRQRIVLRREMARQPEGSPLREALLAEYDYDAVQTCAADGSCAIACPVGIDTGRLVKQLRAGAHGERAERLALGAARRYAAVERAARAGLSGGDALTRALGPGPLRAAGGALRRAVGDELVPQWPRRMPRPAPARLPDTAREGAVAVYVPACVNRVFGAARDAPAGPALPQALVAVSARAGRPLWIPPDVAGHCCGLPWTSKGYEGGAAAMARRSADALWRWSGEGELPVVVDAASCSLAFATELGAQLPEELAARHERLEVIDSLVWAREPLLPRLTVKRRLASAAVHPPCATRHAARDGDLVALAQELADEVVAPVGATCCGFAGDRGMLHPELVDAATAEQRDELAGRSFDDHLCGNRTCEIGLHEASGRPYRSPVQALDELTRG